MVTDIHSPLRKLSFTGALIALLSVGCTVATPVGSEDNPLTGPSNDVQAIAHHQAPDLTTLHVAVSTFPLSCANPTEGVDSTDGTCPIGWTVDFALPSASQAPGVYSLSDPALQSFASVAAGGTNQSCIGGGGGGFAATAEILSIDASTLKLRLSGFNSDGDLPPADGDYDVTLCE